MSEMADLELRNIEIQETHRLDALHEPCSPKGKADALRDEVTITGATCSQALIDTANHNDGNDEFERRVREKTIREVFDRLSEIVCVSRFGYIYTFNANKYHALKSELLKGGG